MQQPLGSLALPRQLGVGRFERREGGVSLEQPRVGLGVEPHAGLEFHRIRQLHEVVGGAAGEQFGLHGWLLHGRQHDDRHVRGGRQGAKALDHVGPFDVGHDEILEDHRGPQRCGGLDGRGGVASKLNLRIGQVGEHALDHRADERLVVHDEDTMARSGVARRGRDRGHGVATWEDATFRESIGVAGGRSRQAASVWRNPRSGEYPPRPSAILR
jgi:hypothetical protein